MNKYEEDYGSALYDLDIRVGFVKDKAFFNKNGSLTKEAIEIGELAEYYTNRLEDLKDKFKNEFEDYLNSKGYETCMGAIRRKVDEA